MFFLEYFYRISNALIVREMTFYYNGYNGQIEQPHTYMWQNSLLKMIRRVKTLTKNSKIAVSHRLFDDDVCADNV